MWISAHVFESLVRDRSLAEGRVAVLERENVATRTTMDWMTMRLTQLEHERATLIYQFMGVKIAVPTIEAPLASIEASDINSVLPSFNDVGDEEAARLGLGWNDQGELVETRK